MIFCVSILIFCLEPTVREELHENATVMVFFLKVPLRNYLIKPCSKFFREDREDAWTYNHLHNNPSLLFEEHCTKTFHLLLYTSFTLKQTQFMNFKFCWSDNFCHSLFYFLLIDILCILDVIQSLQIFIRTSKVLMRLNVVVFFARFTAPECPYHVFIFHETFVPVNCRSYSRR